MLYGVSGSSGSGKTTVCRMVADSLGITFLKTSITEVAAKNGFNAIGRLTLQDRMRLQDLLLEDHIEKINKTQTPAILDRTPIDFISYMLGEIDMHAYERLMPAEMIWINAYVRRCMETTIRYYDYIFHLCPLPLYEISISRPAENPAYQVHTDLIMRGVLESLEDRIGRSIMTGTDLAFRVDHIHNVIVTRLNTLEYYRKTNKLLN